MSDQGVESFETVDPSDVEKNQTLRMVYESRAGGVSKVPVRVKDASTPSKWVVVVPVDSAKNVEYRVCGWDAVSWDHNDLLKYDPSYDDPQTLVGTFRRFEDHGGDGGDS